MDRAFNHEDEDMHLNGNSNGGFDTCGYEASSVMTVDTRNTKWQARQNGESTATSNKSHNFKEYQKQMKRKNAQMDRAM